jgi:hypothetical protein
MSIFMDDGLDQALNGGAVIMIYGESVIIRAILTMISHPTSLFKDGDNKRIFFPSGPKGIDAILSSILYNLTYGPSVQVFHTCG